MRKLLYIAMSGIVVAGVIYEVYNYDNLRKCM